MVYGLDVGLTGSVAVGWGACVGGTLVGGTFVGGALVGTEGGAGLPLAGCPGVSVAIIGAYVGVFGALVGKGVLVGVATMTVLVGVGER